MLNTKAIDSMQAGKLFDKGVTPGLFCLVLPSGKKVWRLKYTRDGRERSASLGVWPDVTIDEARERAKQARRLFEKGVHPTEHDRIEKQASDERARVTFGIAADDWLEWTRSQNKSEKTVQKAEWVVKLWRPVRSRPIGEITTPELFKVLQRFEEAGKHETAHRMKSVAVRIFDRAAVKGWVDKNPASLIGRQLLPVKAKSHAGITNPKQLGQLLRFFDAQDFAGFTVRNALQLLAHVFVRPGELRMMEWSELRDLDGEEPLWVIPKERMKMRRPHVVPLSRQAVNIIKEQSIVSAESRYVFPNGRSLRSPMSENAMGVALKANFITPQSHVPHGFRTTASTLLRELKFESELIEMQLAHRTGNSVASIYDRSERIPERRKMMERWSDYLDELKESNK